MRWGMLNSESHFLCVLNHLVKLDLCVSLKGYGTATVPTTSNSSNKSLRENSNSAIIKRFNHHSAMVLAAGLRKAWVSGHRSVSECLCACVTDIVISMCVIYRDAPSDQASETSSTDGNSRDSDFFQTPLKKVNFAKANGCC